MFRLFEFLLGSLLVTAFTVASIFFFALHYILRVGGIAECAWHGSARTWLDANGNGRIDPGEQPLGGVEIHVDDIGNQLFDIGWPAVTGRDGDVPLFVSIPGCEDTMFEIHVKIPDGYRLTTPARVQVYPEVWGRPGNERVYSFGFEVDY